jgi:hypothetical protein
MWVQQFDCSRSVPGISDASHPYTALGVPRDLDRGDSDRVGDVGRAWHFLQFRGALTRREMCNLSYPGCAKEVETLRTVCGGILSYGDSAGR